MLVFAHFRILKNFSHHIGFDDQALLRSGKRKYAINIDGFTGAVARVGADGAGTAPTSHHDQP